MEAPSASPFVDPHQVGHNHSTLRDHNERLILSLLQRSGGMSGGDIAKVTGLSAQTVSVILRRLEAEGLSTRGQPVRGKVGKPSVPIMLNPRGAFSIGAKIGRRTTEVLLLDFDGAVLAEDRLRYPYPNPKKIIKFLQTNFAKISNELDAESQNRIAGIGIALPYEIWKWHETIGAPKAELAAWEDFDFKAEIAKFSDLPVFVENDGTAATQAEHSFGKGPRFRDYCYFFLGSFIGGGIVIGNSVYSGRHGNAGAVGSLPSIDKSGRHKQLIDTASIYLLEDAVMAEYGNADIFNQNPLDWQGLDPFVDDWLNTITPELTRAALTVSAVIDFEAVVVDGAIPACVRADLVRRVTETLKRADTRGLIQPTIVEGTIGPGARALGAGSIPLLSAYFLDTHS